MNLQKINQALAKRFEVPVRHPYKRRILFWCDEEGEFLNDLHRIDFGDAKLLVIDNNYFDIKHTLEVKDPESHYVVYSSKPRPEYRLNWLMDIQLYSEEFSADRASIIMDELGVETLSLKPALKENLPFFESKARLQALKDLDAPLTSAKDLQSAILAVVCRCKTVDFQSAMLNIFMDKIDQEENEFYQQIVKYPGEAVFWGFVKERLGYESPDPSLEKLFNSLVLTVVSTQISRPMDQKWGHLYLTKKNNAQILIDYWMNHRENAEVYDYLARQTFHKLEIQKQIEDWPPEECLEADAFDFFDKIIIRGIIQKLLEDQEDYDEWLGWINKRKGTHWHHEFLPVYQALEAAIQLYRFRRRYADNFPKLPPAEMMERYAADYFRADQLYRRFYFYYGKVTSDILKDLSPKVDDLYCNWFLENLSHAWSDVVEENLVERWSIEGVRSQQDFYNFYIKNNVLLKKERGKIFVIVSDALRYEVAKELETKLLKEFRGETQLEFMLGCIPSFTALGMAALLPNKKITLNPQNKICVDGVDVSTTANRDAVLKKAHPGSAAVKLVDLLSASVEKAREMVRDCRVVYVYHNTIDAVGEQSETEEKIFDAAAAAIQEITDAVKKIVNSLSTTNVIITADHGFLFQKSMIQECDKIQKSGVNGIINNRRFLLAEQGDPVEGSLQISLSSILESGADLAAYVPRGSMRFKHSGGSLYVHGGASLQEIVIPVLRYTNIRKQSQKAKEAKKVDVVLTNT
ncbi:MAG: BREX-1 system phosphatase PglZ type A, partial [Candidatus Omnitrophica bacterium]|nr:BREX-1 system phosphatase PglZ type A [Candidatus Omnitrophota bacterium]